MRKVNGIFSGILLACTILSLILGCENQSNKKAGGKKVRAAPVEVAAVEHGPIALYRTFNGTLEAQSEFVVAPKVAGRIERLTVNLADPVARGQIVAELDNDEYIQAVAQARADLAVAQANLIEAKSVLGLARREFDRVEILKKRGVASDSQFDTVKADLAAKKARQEVAEAQVTRAEALLETANIRLSYTKVIADWNGGDDQRVVAERYVDEGHTVSANAPLMLIVELNPLTGIIFVTEKDYAQLRQGQVALLTTDAFPGETFAGHVERISPVFRQETRQARVELSIDNPDFRLKPGLFIRSTVKLASKENATIIPLAALTSRDDQTGVFVVNEADMTVSWQPITVGIRQGERVEVNGENLSGRVVSLGHQLIDNGSSIIIPDSSARKATTQ